MVHHTVQHLGCGNNILTTGIDPLNQHLLDNRNILQRNLNTHVAAGNHNAVGNTQDFVDVVDALCIFNLRNDFDGVAAVLLQDFTNLQNILRAAGKGSCDKVKPGFDTKTNIIAVLVA